MFCQLKLEWKDISRLAVLLDSPPPMSVIKLSAFLIKSFHVLYVSMDKQTKAMTFYKIAVMQVFHKMSSNRKIQLFSSLLL